MESGNSFCLIKNFDFDTISVWKHFNVLTRLQPHAFILYFRVKIQNHHNIFLACPMGLVFAEDATNVLE